MNRINLITLGVRNMTVSVQFYRDGLGFETNTEEDAPGIVFFNNEGTKLALYPLKELAKETGEKVEDPGQGFSGMTLAYNAKSVEEVDAIIQQAASAGGRVAKEPEWVFWGGYSGYFKDPDGYIWEAAYAEFWKFDEQNMLILE
ncbi:glyoxalase [Marinococcus halophilus]|uniref:Glyoxalase n=1 Tax=Marinococcus halophilus TaxID=1371 RepID=A0A510Y5J5_MARHA|nr:VOC family protein [Marinococcus halophilus]OZT79816.1 glyoxalase [Marinococcus halophilus]GEK58636.1 glyoxalase [Marinococcus halophilus]